MLEDAEIPKIIREKTKHCDVVTDLTNLELQCKRYMARNRPVLLKGAAKEWAACKKWSMAYFRDSDLGSTLIDVSLDGCESGKKEKQSLRDFITSFRHNESTNPEPRARFPPYMRAWYFADDDGGQDLLNDFPNPPSYFPDKFKRLDPQFQPPFTWLFVGPQGAYSPLHRDIWFTCAWMAQIEGRKRFVFFSPDDLKHVYRKENGKEVYIDLSPSSTEEDWAKFPSVDQTSPLEAILEPGDVLYIPSKWAHYVESLTPSVSLTSNFANELNFKHVLIPYTSWLERRQKVMAIMKVMRKAAASAANSDSPSCESGQTQPVDSEAATEAAATTQPPCGETAEAPPPAAAATAEPGLHPGTGPGGASRPGRAFEPGAEAAITGGGAREEIAGEA